MLEERDKIEGDWIVEHDTRLYGLVTGSVTVRPGRSLILHGMIGGNLTVERAATAHVYGTVYGDVSNEGGHLHVWGSGVVRGAIAREASLKIEAGARVMAFTTSGKRASPVPDCEDLAGLHVLVVEDDEGTRDVVAELLTSCCASPMSAGGGEDGFEVFRKKRPDVVLADLWMPDVTGYDLIRRIRELPVEEGGATPAIAMTASSNDSRDKALRAGFQAYISKPFEPNALIELLRGFRKAS